VNSTKMETFHAQFPSLPLVLSECCSCTTQRNNRNVSSCMEQQGSPGLLSYVSGNLGVWTSFDYIGESEQWPAVYSSFGNFDIAGFAKPNAFWYRTNWLGLIDSKDPGRPPVAAPVTIVHILSLVDQLKNGVLTGITSAPYADLLIDGASQGKQSTGSSGMPVAWSGITSSFRNATMVAMDSNGNVLASTTRLAPTGPAAVLALTVDVPSPSTGTGNALLLDGADTALIRATLTDSNGVPVTTEQVAITWSVISGPGRLLGVGSGNCTDHSEPQGTSVPTFMGVARGVFQVSVDCVSPNRDLILATSVDGNIRTTVLAPGAPCPSGPIVVQASAPGFAPATISIAVSGDVENDSVLAVAAANIVMPPSFPYMDDFTN
jgi:hypothetical protein